MLFISDMSELPEVTLYAKAGDLPMRHCCARTKTKAPCKRNGYGDFDPVYCHAHQKGDLTAGFAYITKEEAEQLSLARLQVKDNEVSTPAPVEVEESPTITPTVKSPITSNKRGSKKKLKEEAQVEVATEETSTGLVEYGK